MPFFRFGSHDQPASSIMAEQTGASFLQSQPPTKYSQEAEEILFSTVVRLSKSRRIKSSQIAGIPKQSNGGGRFSSSKIEKNEDPPDAIVRYPQATCRSSSFQCCLLRKIYYAAFSPSWS